MPTQTPVSHVSDTARWVAIYRAMESERPDALFRDPYARKLAGTQGESIVDGLKKGRQLDWPMIVRTVLMDEIIMRLVTDHGVNGVLNLAAGLDTRPYRLPLPTTLRWFEADLPDILTYKETQLATERPACALERVKVDLTQDEERRALFERVSQAATNVLVIAEGLLVYLTSEQVTALTLALHANTGFRWWLIDIAAPRLLKMLQRTWGKQLEAGNAPLIFAPAQGTAFFEPLGWHEIEFRSMFEESIRLNRTVRFARLWQWMGRLYPKKKQEEFRRMSGVVLFERNV
jgi:methyltransferase (TIGR00027 family)